VEVGGSSPLTSTRQVQVNGTIAVVDIDSRHNVIRIYPAGKLWLSSKAALH